MVVAGAEAKAAAEWTASAGFVVDKTTLKIHQAHPQRRGNLVKIGEGRAVWPADDLLTITQQNTWGHAWLLLLMPGR